MQSETVKTDDHLDRNLEQTFPASDPVPAKNITGTEPPGSDVSRRSPKPTAQDVEAAAPRTIDCPCCNGVGKIVAPEN